MQSTRHLDSLIARKIVVEVKEFRSSRTPNASSHQVVSVQLWDRPFPESNNSEPDALDVKRRLRMAINAFNSTQQLNALKTSAPVRNSDIGQPRPDCA
jgi:hypothetical protein